MTIKQKLLLLLAVPAIITTSAGLLLDPVSAATCGKGANGEEIKTAIIQCDDGIDNSSAESSAVWQLLLQVLQILTAGIGILAVGGIVYGSLLYTTAGDKAEQTKKAIGIITNTIIGIVAYGLMYVVLNFLIPGGIFS